MTISTHLERHEQQNNGARKTRQNTHTQLAIFNFIYATAKITIEFVHQNQLETEKSRKKLKSRLANERG